MYSALILRAYTHPRLTPRRNHSELQWHRVHEIVEYIAECHTIIENPGEKTTHPQKVDHCVPPFRDSQVVGVAIDGAER